MASNQTEHYGLPQWSMDDRILMDEFNGAMKSIDAALHAKVVTGTYTGDGEESRTIALGATPKAVLLVRDDGVMGYKDASGNNYVYGALAVEDAAAVLQEMEALKIVEGGFIVYCTSKSSKYYVYTNHDLYSYHYVAFF